jgi:hypothetical protein
MKILRRRDRKGRICIKQRNTLRASLTNCTQKQKMAVKERSPMSLDEIFKCVKAKERGTDSAQGCDP